MACWQRSRAAVGALNVLFCSTRHRGMQHIQPLVAGRPCRQQVRPGISARRANGGSGGVRRGAGAVLPGDVGQDGRQRQRAFHRNGQAAAQSRAAARGAQQHCSGAGAGGGAAVSVLLARPPCCLAWPVWAVDAAMCVGCQGRDRQQLHVP